MFLTAAIKTNKKKGQMMSPLQDGGYDVISHKKVLLPGE